MVCRRQWQSGPCSWSVVATGALPRSLSSPPLSLSPLLDIFSPNRPPLFCQGMALGQRLGTGSVLDAMAAFEEEGHGVMRKRTCHGWWIRGGSVDGLAFSRKCRPHRQRRQLLWIQHSGGGLWCGLGRADFLFSEAGTQPVFVVFH